MNGTEATKLVALAKVYWPNSFAGQTAADLVTVAKGWLTVMPEVPYEDAAAVMAVLARDGERFAPGPGLIVWAYYDRLAVRTNQAAPDADEAWAELMGPNGVNQRGGWHAGQPEWSHPAVTAVAAAIGWDELCHGDIMIVRAHVMRLYPSVLVRVERDARHERTDTALGFRNLFKPVPPAAPELQ